VKKPVRESSTESVDLATGRTPVRSPRSPGDCG
jgi:hypothetical protein